MNILTKGLQNDRIFYGLVAFIAAVLSIWICLFQPVRGSFATTYNDYIIYEQSFHHLLQHNDFYAHYPNEYNDLYKYSPAFALFMAPFAILPNALGCILWNVFNFLILFYSFRNFSFYNEKANLLAMGFILIEALTCLSCSQCNCLLAGLLIITYECLENKKIALAAFVVVVATFIKPFGLAAFLLFLLYPQRLKGFSWIFVWSLVLLIIPLIVISPTGLLGEYKSWFLLLKTDHDNSVGLSIMGVLHTWFGLDDKIFTLLLGLVVLLLPLVRHKSFINPLFRQLFLASILIWVIIFNHKAETFTYIIAVCGIAIWYFTQPFKWLNLVLLLLALLIIILQPLDLFPRSFRDAYLGPYLICVVPCILIWLKITAELMIKDFRLSDIDLKKAY